MLHFSECAHVHSSHNLEHSWLPCLSNNSQLLSSAALYNKDTIYVFASRSCRFMWKLYFFLSRFIDNKFLSLLLRVKRHSVIHLSHPVVSQSHHKRFSPPVIFIHPLQPFTTLNWDAKERLATTNWNFPPASQQEKGWLKCFQIEKDM